jgi:hypothetical protein
MVARVYHRPNRPAIVTFEIAPAPPLHATACPLWDKQCRTSLSIRSQIRQPLYNEVVSPSRAGKDEEHCFCEDSEAVACRLTNRSPRFMPLLVRSGTSSAERL